jgi:hypothetical protein
MIRRKLKRSEHEAVSYAAWNEFVHLLAMEPAEALTETQRHAHFAFWYDSEVQNGGHLQYFENQGTGHVESALRGLQMIGAHLQHSLLSAAVARWLSNPRKRIETGEEYVATALQDEFGDLDSAYYSCKPDITSLLHAYLDSHFNDFVELT